MSIAETHSEIAETENTFSNVLEMAVDYEALSLARLKKMSRAADDVLEAYRLLGKAGANTVSRVIEHQGTFYEMDHYPKGDVYDEETAAQYYYHAHRPENGEHGHFHTFIRANAIPERLKPMPEDYSGEGDVPLGEDAICHLIAISMDEQGLPMGLFTTNRWVTGETFYRAKDTIRLIDHFMIDHAYPCLATNRWISAMLSLFRPQIENLLLARDEALINWQAQNPQEDVYEARALEVTSEMVIDVDLQIDMVDKAYALKKQKNF